MIKLFPNEQFKKIEMEHNLKLNYAISNYGRLVSYDDNILLGSEIFGGLTEGFRIFRFAKVIDGKKKYFAFQFSRLVANYFIPNDDIENKKFVIHLDHNKLNDKVENLRWATQKQVTDHNKKNPLVIAGREKTIQHNIKSDSKKLTSTQVIRIKKMLQRGNHNTRFTIIAKQFNISTQQLYRIRTGENWGHIKI